jgi:hypothetical protein
MHIDYRDWQEHQVGPIILRFTGPGDHGPTGISSIASRPGVAFKLDYPIAEGIARTIEDSADLWTIKENDTRYQATTGEERGNLRIDLTNDKAMLGEALSLYADTPFFMSRLVTGAGLHRIAVRAKGYRTTDYRRSQFRIQGGNAPQGDTRHEFVKLAGIIARLRNPDLSADWEASMLDLFWAADATYEGALAIHAAIEDEDHIATASAAKAVE